MKKLAHISVLICCILISFVANGQFSMEKTIKTPPSPMRLVNDFTTTLTEDQRQALENKLVRFDDSTSTQITVVIVPSLDGMDIVDAATELGRSWQVGQAKKNNGVVMLISVEEKNRKMSIAPGYGLEGVLPDVTCKQIIDDIIIPKFKGDDYYRGIDEGTDAIIQATKGEFKASAHSRKKGLPFGRIIFYIVMIIVFLAAFGGGSKGGGSFMSRRGMSAWTIGTMMGGSGGSGWGGGGGGGGGGSFGGFGGGSFGGGGSSGSW